jgi:hypothetical protein
MTHLSQIEVSLTSRSILVFYSPLVRDVHGVLLLTMGNNGRVTTVDHSQYTLGSQSCVV